MSFDESRPRRRRGTPGPLTTPGEGAAADEERRGTPASIGARVAYYRERATLSQAELSRVTGVPQSTISLIEAGGSSPRLDTVQQLAPGLGVTVAELAGEAVPGAPDLPPEDAAFVHAFQRLPPELREQMRAIMDVIRSSHDRKTAAPSEPTPESNPRPARRESGAGGGGGR